MKQSDINHLRRLLGWVRTEIGQDPDELVQTMTGVVGDPSISRDEMLATAWLHDCIEDQGVESSTLERLFGSQVASGVLLLSDLEEGNRSTRKQLSRERIAKAPGWVQTIKCADLISNTSSIVSHDPCFARVYLEEKRLLLNVMDRADPRLLSIAREYASRSP